MYYVPGGRTETAFRARGGPVRLSQDWFGPSGQAPRAVLLTLSLVIGACAPGSPDARQADGKARCFVTILPQAEFLKRVGGDFVEVEVLVSPGQSYHVFEPTARTVAALAEADIYFTLGASFEEPLVEKVRGANARLEVVDTGAGISRRPGEACSHSEESHDHVHGEPDPHIWLDPMLVKVQARNIAAALVRRDPAHAASFEMHLAEFAADLDAVNARIAGELAPFKGRAFFVYHPAFGYFADAYGLRQVAVEAEGKEPGPRRLAALVDEAKAHRARVVFIEPQFPTAGAEAVAREIGGSVQLLDPLAPDYLENLLEMSEKIAASMRSEDVQGALASPRR